MDACTTDCSALCQAEAYHTVFLQHVLEEERPICKIEALNATMAVKLWAPNLVGKRVSLYSDSSTAVAILQTGKGRNSHIQVCAKEIWLACVLHDITLMCTHTLVTVYSALQMPSAGSTWVEYIRTEYMSS